VNEAYLSSSHTKLCQKQTKLPCSIKEDKNFSDDEDDEAARSCFPTRSRSRSKSRETSRTAKTDIHQKQVRKRPQMFLGYH